MMLFLPCQSLTVKHRFLSAHHLPAQFRLHLSLLLHNPKPRLHLPRLKDCATKSGQGTRA
jgi:hypothetical protein